ncbi:RNA polymerase I associated factor, A49-like protein [Kalmanozyma brasiliensis GHG001]|uniref:Subunit of DNA-directed RNA polymerase I n=1 Tax=Kalmanozyma brasiliensis (strain GHG001) TaxID=1365824 RepID=V5EGE8_KALBG|nr:RNA polymerase I associated factor, A49-like protein [Kalmanozyma brasiliensis GHG001]EST09611.1 RNA polymerase I associated factor, A49-like protein [Kalmanozyma brasiliensis GHG001]
MSKGKDSPAKDGKRKSKFSDAADSPKKSKKASTSANAAASSSTSKAGSGQATLSVKGSGSSFKQLSKSGAAFASFADYNPAPSTKFSIYRADGLPDETGASTNDTDERLLLAGETDTMAYVGNNFEFGSSSEARGYTGHYMVGVYDPSSSSVTLRAVPTFQVARSIKANSSLSSISSKRTFADYGEMTAARRALGDAFGNRKQKANARNQDRMKVDTANMEVILDDFTGGIQDNLASLPSLDEVLASSTSSRPMPPANLDAKHPAEAYRISDLIPSEIFKSLPIQKLIDNVSDPEALKELLPYSKDFPAWIWSRLVDNLQRSSHLSGGSGGKKHTTFDEDEDEAASVTNAEDVMMMPALGATEDKEDAKTKVRIAYYMSLLWYIQSRPKSVSQRGKLITALKLDGEDANKRIVKAILGTFTETPANSDRAVMSAFHQTKVLAYMCALALHLDNFSVDHDKLARNCNIPPATLRELFRTLGCTASVVGGEKRMVLKTPFTLPQPRKGKAGGRK